MSDLSSSPEENTTVHTTKQSRTKRRKMNRRHFLKASVVGAGALAAMPTLGTGESVSAAPPTQGDGQGRLNEKDDSDPLALDNLPNVAETWVEPWTWRPSDWPGQSLPLHVVENAAPLAITGTNFQNAKPLLFSYNGTTPGPTIRMKGDETLFIHLRNLLGPDLGRTPVGVYPDIGASLPGPEGFLFNAKGKQFGSKVGQVPATVREDWCLGEHTNGVHSNHVTNLHTHGLHVRPATNPDGTHTDNVILRVMPQADWLRREADIDASCRFIRENEVIGQAPYEFRLGNVQNNPMQPHPAGTFWYHPHAHGATHNQVAAGMAGFLIVEGDIEEALYEQFVGMKQTDKAENQDEDVQNHFNKLPYNPSRRTGRFDYRERLIFIQRVQVTANDPDTPTENIGPRQKKVIFDTTNGSFEPRIITMRPGAIERWRILNGSVDGKSYLRFMVLKGRYEFKGIPNNTNGLKGRAIETLFRIEDDGDETAIRSMAELRNVKQRLWLLAWDGITLVRERKTTSKDKYEYYIQDLGFDAKPDPLAIMDPKESFKDIKNIFPNVADCYKDAASVKASYVQPNELDMSAANRADVLFQAPSLDEGSVAEIYTIVGMGTPLHADGGPRPDTIVAYLIVSGEAVEGAPKSLQSIIEKELTLPDVADYLKPITNDELMVLAPNKVPEGLPRHQEYVLKNEISQYNETVAAKTETVVDVDQPTGKKTTVITVQKPKKVKAGNFRSRKITYSGWGAAGFPAVTVPDEYVEKLPDQQKLRYYEAPKSITIPGITLPDGERIRARTITNLRQPDDSPLPTLLLPPGTRTMAIDGRKFNPTDSVHPQMLWWTAEEWMLTNNSTTLWRDPNASPILFTGTNLPTHKEVDDILETLKKVKEPKRQELKDIEAIYTNFQKNKVGSDASNEYVYWKDHDNVYPMTRSEAAKKNYEIATNAADHPFHMHQNPFWVMRIEVPDEEGNLVNILEQPRWQDTIWIPRNGGRVIFRSRFPDYLGVYVNHCHLLLHEDNGMMQAVETVPTANSANYIPADKVLSAGMSEKEINDLYPTVSKNLGQAWLASIQFIDPDPKTGQVYPGFEPEIPSPNS